MQHSFLKVAGVKDEKAFYKLYPTEESFFSAFPHMKDGGSIHIKPSHEGRFTAYKKRTGKTTEEALHSKDPHVRQMANFARNAKHFKHQDGGYVPEFDVGGISPAGEFTLDISSTHDDNTWKTVNENSDATMQDVYKPVQVANQEAIKVPSMNEIAADEANTTNPSPAPKRTGWQKVNGVASIIGQGLELGMVAADAYGERKHERELQSFNREQGDTMHRYAPVTQPGSHGDYTQQGVFRPDKRVPTNSGVFYPTIAEYGGQQGGNSFALDKRVTPYTDPSKVSVKNPFMRVNNTLEESSNPNIVIEKKEQVLGDFNQDGSLQLLGTPTGTGSHDSGNDLPVNVPANSFTFPDTKDLKIKDASILSTFGLKEKKGGYTHAEIAKKFSPNKFKAVIDNPNSSPDDIKTNQLNYDNVLAKLNNLSMLQETMKMQKGKEYFDPATQQIAKYGGKVKKMKFAGVPYAPEDDNSDDIRNFQYDFTQKYPKQSQIIIDALGYPNTGTLVDGLNGPRTSMMHYINGRYNGQDQDVSNPTNQINPLNPTITNLPVNIQQPDMANKREVPFTDTTVQNTRDQKVKGKRNKWGVQEGDPNTLRDMVLMAQAAKTHRFQPINDNTPVVLADTVFESDLPIRNALSEITNTIVQGMQDNTPSGRASGMEAQGKLLSSSVQGLGEVTNDNVKIANPAGQIATTKIEANMKDHAYKLSELNKANFLSDRDYQREIGKLEAEYIQGKMVQHDINMKRAWSNMNSKYYNIGPNGFPVFKSQEAKDNFFRDLQNPQATYQTMWKKIWDEAPKNMTNIERTQYVNSMMNSKNSAVPNNTTQMPFPTDYGQMKFGGNVKNKFLRTKG